MSLANFNHPLLRSFRSIGEQLIQQGYLSAEQLYQAAQSAESNHVPLVAELVNSGMLDGKIIAGVAATEFGMPVMDLTVFNHDFIPEGVFTAEFMHENQVLPLYKRGSRLYVAIADPVDVDKIDRASGEAKTQVNPVLVAYDALTAAIEAVTRDHEAELDSSLDDELNDIEFENQSSVETEDVANADVDNKPVVKYINKVLMDAIKAGASDIHFEPYEKKYRIRYRIDGMLSEKGSPPPTMSGNLAARLKVMSQMNIAERRVPQDGRIKLKLSKNRAIDFRVNTCPTLYGEKVVLRVLDSSAAEIGIEALGFEPEQQETFLKAIKNPYGMILVTGPTGSGKTVSLYTALNLLNKPEVNISTAEDPVEIQVAGINQVNVNPKAGLTFAEALRAFLRQDPDVVMVGEIRDLETAEIAVKAAQTGHLVLSTLHTNNAAQTLSRLSNMGVPAFNIASSVNLILAQRLARRLCPNCKKPSDLAHDALVAEGFDEKLFDGPEFTVYEANHDGCPKCTHGYKGRVGIYELMPVSEEMGKVLMAGANALDIAEQAAREGFTDLRTSGLLKVKAGITSLEEVNRVTKE